MPLCRRLEDMPSATTIWNASFSELDDMIPGKLPPAARKYNAWWGNHPDANHSQAKAWIAAGWEVSKVNIFSETVTFIKTLN